MADTAGQWHALIDLLSPTPQAALDWGPSVESLPVMTRFQWTQHLEGGAKLMLIDGLVHDVADFVRRHPAGPALVRAYIGKDATAAFNGGVYNHSHGARNILARMRVARICCTATCTH